MSGLTEHEILSRLLESVKQAADCCNAMAIARMDERWSKAATTLRAMRDNVATLATRRITLN